MIPRLYAQPGVLCAVLFVCGGTLAAQPPAAPRTAPLAMASGALDTEPPAARSRAQSLGAGVSGVPAYSLGEPQTDEIPAAVEGPAKRAGFHRAPGADLSAAGRWETLTNGERVWRVAIHSPGARMLRLHFASFDVAGGAVWLYPERDGASPTLGPYTGTGPFADGEFWSGIVGGDNAVIEYVPDPAIEEPGLPPFTVDLVSHLDPALLQPRVLESPAPGTERLGLGDAAYCQLDVTCYPQWQASATGVAHIYYDRPDGAYVCTGFLLNATSNSRIPYFMTNNHCIPDAFTARTVTAVWNWQSSSCGARPGNYFNYPQTSGASLLVTRSDLDFTLLRLDGAPPAGALFLGWDASRPAQGSAITTIGHPEGDYKRIAFGRLYDNTDHFGVDYTQGFTEPGSSGSPWFREPGVVAALHNASNAANYSSSSRCVASAQGLLSGRGYLFSAIYPNIRQYLDDCSYTISSTSATVPAAGGNGSFTVSTTSGCSWTAQANQAWITITTGSTGTGNGTVSYAVAQNTSAASRTGTITAGGRTFTITQAGGASCSYVVAPASITAPVGGTGGSIQVTADSGCSWSVTNPAAWIVLSASSGTGSGTFSYTVAANSGVPRSAALTVAGQTVTVTQAGVGGGGLQASVSPASGSGASATFSFQINVPGGAANLVRAQFLIRSAVGAANACLVYFTRSSNTFLLLNDAGTAWLGPVTPGTSGTLVNSQCTVQASGSSASASGSTQTVNLAVAFQAAYAGPRNVYAELLDAGGFSTGYQSVGSWTVTAGGGGPAPAAPVTVSPASGSGASQAFTFQFTSAGGAASVARGQILFNNGLSAANGCLVYYNRAGNSLMLLNDAGTAWVGPAALGSGGALGNSQCTVNPASSSASGAGNTQTLILAISFQTGFAGAKTVFAEMMDGGGSTGYQTVGSWTVTAGGGGPAPATPVSVTPNAGSGAAQTFRFLLNSPDGASPIVRAQVLFHTTVAGASGCLIYYDRGTNRLLLLNDAGTVWLGPLAPGGTGSLQNGQCSIQAAGSAASGGPTSATLDLAVSFAAGFAGAKTVYAELLAGSQSTGYQTVGSWTVTAAATGNQPPSVGPASTTGGSLFTIQLNDPNGYTDLARAQILFHNTLTVAGGCLVYYTAASNTLQLLNDAGNAWLGPILVGGGSLANSQCTLAGAGSSAVKSGNTITLRLLLGFSTQFSGTRNLFAEALDAAGLTTGYQALGSFLLAGPLPPAVRTDAALRTTLMARGDDISSPGRVPFGFNVNFFGANYDGVWVNNNGNATFTGPLSAYNPSGLAAVGMPVLAPFFADVDTLGAASQAVSYGRGIVDGRPAFAANWVDVGYYSLRSDKLNRFQLVVIDRSDTGPGNFDLEYNYDRILWETGDASGGRNGLGGNSATVGYSNGTAAGTLEWTGSRIPGSFLDGGPRSLAGNLLNSAVPGRYVFAFRAGRVQ